MKFAKIAAVALLASAPVAASAQQADPFVSTQIAPSIIPIVIGGVIAVAVIAGNSETSSSGGTTGGGME